MRTSIARSLRHSVIPVPALCAPGPLTVLGFSLIELLVVIAVIALVAALLLPALTRGKGSAQRIRCVSNLHQLGLATHLYWDENAGSCFRYSAVPTTQGQLYWFGWMGSGSEGNRDFDVTQGVLYPYLKGRGAELCPSFNYVAPGLKLKATGASFGYGYNLYLSAPPQTPAVRTARIIHPDQKALFADAAQINTWQAPASPDHPMIEEWYYIDDNSTQPNGHFRHAAQANVNFCDGHVRPERMVPDSLDKRLPNQLVGSLRSEILRLP